jgi:hypothetical protein
MPLSGLLMEVLQQILNKVVTSVPTMTLERLIAKKLRGQGAKFPKALPGKLAEHMLSGTAEPFRYSGRTQLKDISLSFDDSDGEEVASVMNRFLEVELPILVPVLAERIAKTTLMGLRKNWTDEQRLQQEDLSGFRTRMDETWGKPLGELRMLLTIAREWCGEAHRESANAESMDKSSLRRLMVRFLVRSCQVTDEIICLLENGFADGAMARWRTLHEIGVVAAVISKYGEDCAERYYAHQAIESKRAMTKYLACYKYLGYRPLGIRTMKKIEKRYASAISKYGKSFKSDFGWAAHHFKNQAPTFADLEAGAGYAHMRAHYQMGNDNVHAGIKSMYSRLGLLTDYDSLLAGRSNAGLTDPGQNTAHTLTQIAALVCISPKLDDLVTAKIMEKLRDGIPQAFGVADSRLRRKHKAFTKVESAGPSDLVDC